MEETDETMRFLQKQYNKKWMLPLMTFIVGCLILTAFLYHSYDTNRKQVRTITELNASTYAERLRDDMNRGGAITDALKAIIISGNGTIDNFEKVSENLMSDFVQSIQIAPDGVITEIYPEEGNEEGKIDLLHDESRGEICRYGRDNNCVTMQGPFDLKQGGRGIAVRNPVYLETADGNSVFWGFTIVVIRVPEIFEESVRALTDFEYDYCLTKTVSPLSEECERISFSKENLADPVTYTFEFGGCTFYLAVTPKDGWNQGRKILPNLVLGFFIVLFLTGLVIVILVIEFHREALKKIAITDPLTGLLNRKGFDEQIESAIKDTPDIHCVGIQTDIDDFKFINDVYGHEAGDTALRIFAQSMRNFF